MVGTFAGLILAVVTIFKPTISQQAAYAIMQGLFLGLISRVFAKSIPGIAVKQFSYFWYSWFPFTCLYVRSGNRKF